jgi:hypothetical protein
MATLKLNSYELFTQSENNKPEFGAGVPSGSMCNVVAEETVITATQYPNTSEGLIVTGSSYSYTPHVSAVKVFYQFSVHVANVDPGSVINFQIELDGIVQAGSNHGVYHQQGDQNVQIGMYTLTHIFNAWSGTKTIRTRAAGLNSVPTSYETKLHETDYAVGTENAQPGSTFGVGYVYPKLLIYSIT